MHTTACRGDKQVNTKQRNVYFSNQDLEPRFPLIFNFSLQVRVKTGKHR